jgi:hypothetical protein
MYSMTRLGEITPMPARKTLTSANATVLPGHATTCADTRSDPLSCFPRPDVRRGQHSRRAGRFVFSQARIMIEPAMGEGTAQQDLPEVSP